MLSVTFVSLIFYFEMLWYTKNVRVHVYKLKNNIPHLYLIVYDGFIYSCYFFPHKIEHNFVLL